MVVGKLPLLLTVFWYVYFRCVKGESTALHVAVSLFCAFRCVLSIDLTFRHLRLTPPQEIFLCKFV